MRSSTAFFAGVGTVFVAIAAGVGGGLTIGNVMSPQTPQYGKLDRRAASDSPSTKDPMVPVPYLAATKASSNAPVVVSPAEQKPAQPQQNEAANSSPPAMPGAPQANVTASNEQAPKQAEAAQPDVSKSSEGAAAAKPSVATVQPVVAHEQVSASDDAYAKARDADLKRDADQKRAERRKAERRQQQQWADRRRAQQSREQDDLRSVEESVREDTEARAYPVYRERPVRAEFPQIRLFGDD
jgi:hypothetical protein